MGIYFNTGTKKFNRAINSKIYIDKTGFLAYTNSVIDTEDSYICLSRPRRFGKSITAAMLAAYYGKGFDSSALFDGKKIALSADYKKYMNKYDIIEVDLNVFRRRIDPQTNMPVTAAQTISLFQQEVIQEIKETYPNCVDPEESDLPNAMAKVYAQTGSSFVWIFAEDRVPLVDDHDEGGSAETISQTPARSVQGLYLKRISRAGISDRDPACQKIRHAVGAQQL